MGRSFCVSILIVILVGCGVGIPGTLPVGFLNQTQHSDADLWAIWKTAQRNLARQVDLNPLQRTLHGVPADLRPGDPLALGVKPHLLRVAAKPDVASSALFAATGVYRDDPTGLIACPRPCNVRYAAAYSSYTRPLTRYAASWEFQDDNFAVIVEYEFENQILESLGYDMRWR
jgi:hypothetical protein